MSASITGKTKVIGIFGYPVEHSFSPAMHNAAFAHSGLDYVYVPFAVRPDHLGSAVAGIRALGLAGVNVTIPHKSAVLEFLDELSPEARLIGAVNTIVNRDGVLTGFNTDAAGFVRSLGEEGGVTPQDKRILILGAGGAARAASIQLALAGAKEIVFSTPCPDEVASLRHSITQNTETVINESQWDPQEIAEVLQNMDLIINATPMGMHPKTDEMPPVEIEAIPRGTLVCDLVYNPRETLLLQKARSYGLPTLNGMGMLLYQGAIAFGLWTGTEPPLNIMRRALEGALTID